MRSIKVLLYPLLLLIVFIYGIGVGRFKLFPFESIKVLNTAFKNSRKLKNDSLLAKLAKNNNIELNNTSKELKKISTSINEDSIKFISFGDNEFKNMKGILNSINAQNTSLIVHVGDTQNSSFPCIDSRVDLQRDLMNSLNNPVLYTPGDNEWRDCIDESKGDNYNLERLKYLRETYFSMDKTLGKNPLIVENQRKRGYPENARLKIKNIAFITAHVVGSQNNFDPYSKKNTLEYLQRDAANIEWIKESFERYKEAKAYVLVIHSDIFSSNNVSLLYEKFANSLLELSNKFKRPVLLLHGNLHQFRAFKPMSKKFPFLHVIQNFGYPDVKAIEIEINPSKQIPFNVTQIID